MTLKPHCAFGAILFPFSWFEMEYIKNNVYLKYVNNIKILMFSNVLLLFDFQNINLFDLTNFTNWLSSIKKWRKSFKSSFCYSIPVSYTLNYIILYNKRII